MSAVLPAVPAPTPVRIQRLTLTDFRAFPGPAPSSFDLGGRNLLVYGENGAGKSSIFHALEGFFSFKPAGSLRAHKNVFSGRSNADCRVEVEFADGTPAVAWTVSSHPGSVHSATADARVKEAALRRACLDYRALLATNYKQGDGEVNLFEIAIEQLLRDYPATVAGGTVSTLGELWAVVQASLPRKHTPASISRINHDCAVFNTAFRTALPALVTLVNELMRDLGWSDVELQGFQTPGLTYRAAWYKSDRIVQGRTLTPEIRFRGHALTRPQLFLNEARLSALGLSLYLAGRLASTPSANATALKLLVLDDVLIGLDHSNRLPVLDVLIRRFADWQVVLLTHDRNWFDLARAHLPEAQWQCVEVYEGDTAAPAPMPIVRATQNRPAKALLRKAKDLVNTSYLEAAANYARQAFELGARATCELKRIQIRYCVDPKAHKAQELLDKLKKWQATGGVTQAEWDAAINRLETLKNVVLNPYSHPSAPNIPKAEVEQAIEAVERFLDLANRP